MFDRHIEDGLLGVLKEEGIGCIVFSALAQGLLTERYLEGIPADSRVGKAGRFLRPENVNQDVVERARKLAALARERGRRLTQLPVYLCICQPAITPCLTGAILSPQA